MKRRLFALNTDWLYCPEDDASFGRKACSERRFRPVYFLICLRIEERVFGGVGNAFRARVLR